jgi:hypothetical protein
MNIFDPLISGSLSVSGSGNISGNLTVLGTINATISGTTSNAISASHAASYLLTSSFEQFTGSYTTGSFTGSFGGDGSNLINIPASGVTGLNLTRIADGSVTASVSNTDGLRVNSKTEITGSLIVTDGITGSIDYTNITNKPTLVSGSLQIDITGTTGYSTFSSSISNSIDSLSSSIATTTNNLSTSIATTDLNQSNRLTSIENKTGSYATTGSNLFIGTQTHSGSIIPSVDNSYDLGSTEYQWRDVYISSGSLYIDGAKVLSSTAQELTITTDTGQSIKILEGTTDSIILQTADGDIELKSSADGDILLDPTNGKIMFKGPIEILNGNKIQSSVGGTPVVFANDIVVSGSIELTGTIDGIDLTDFSSSLNTRLGTLEVSTGSINSFTSSASGRLNSLETESGSIRTTVNNYTSSTDGRLLSIETVTGSILTTNTTQTNRLNSIEGVTGSYATTGSNNFLGSQYITGSLTISDNLTVLGSSSIVYSTASQLIVEDNVIVVNSSFPAERFAGLEVHDSGSNGSVTASLFWDGLNNRWIYQNTSEAHYGGGMFIAGPRNTGSLGDEPGLTNGAIPKSIGGDHIGDSIISEFSGSIAINGGLILTGSILSTVSPLVSGSSQISFNGITDKPTLVSGSSQVSFNGITDKPTLVSGSSQITYGSLTGIPSGIVSGSSQVSYTGLSNIPSGIVSGSVQVDLTATTNYSSGIKTRLNAEGVLSGSAQVVAALPAGTVSGSSQISIASTSGFGTYIDQALLTTSTPTHSTLRLTGALSAWNTTTPGTGNGGIHLGATSATSNQGPAITFGARDASSGSNAQAGIYINSDGNYGTRMYLATTDSYAAGSKTAISISETGVVNFVRTNPTVQGNPVWHSGNLTNLNQLTNGPGYISSYTETDTLATVVSRGNTANNKIIINSTGTGGDATLKINTSTSSTFVHSQENLAANLTSGQHNISVIGRTANTKNSGYIGYTWVGDASNSNFVTIGHWGNDDLFRVYGDGTVTPGGNGTQNLGSSSLRWNTIFTSDLSMSNGIGDYTIVEGEEDLFIYNNKTNKVFKFLLQEVDPSVAPAKKVH